MNVQYSTVSHKQCFMEHYFVDFHKQNISVRGQIHLKNSGLNTKYSWRCPPQAASALGRAGRVWDTGPGPPGGRSGLH